MAMQVTPTYVGIDVSKDELVISIEGEKPFTLQNVKKDIKRWLQQLDGAVEFAMEATNMFHLLFADLAYERGYKVFLINAFQLNRYREGVGGRAKTDISDARLLVRYLRNERNDLTPWDPPSQEYRRMLGLLSRRATLVQAKTRIRQSLGGLPELKTSLQSLIKKIDHLDLLIKKRIQQLIKKSDWSDDVERCQAIEGVGELVSTALVMMYHRGHFRSSDAFIAFMGLDVRVRDSGKKRGKRCLTKQGNSEMRRLLYLAAMQAKKKPAWQGYYQRCIDRGMASIQALNVLARKIARVAFALMRNQTEYQPKMA